MVTRQTIACFPKLASIIYCQSPLPLAFREAPVRKNGKNRWQSPRVTHLFQTWGNMHTFLILSISKWFEDLINFTFFTFFSFGGFPKHSSHYEPLNSSKNTSWHDISRDWDVFWTYVLSWIYIVRPSLHICFFFTYFWLPKTHLWNKIVTPTPPR